MKRILAILIALVATFPAYAIERNVASQRLEVFEWDSATGGPKTGDAANLTAYESLDAGAVTTLADTSATELDATKAPGVYWFDMTQAETNGGNIAFTGKSATSGCYIQPRMVATVPAFFSKASIDSSGKVLLQATQSGVTIPTVTTVTNQLTAAQVATGIWQDATSGDFTTTSSIGKSLYTSGAVPGAAGGVFIAGTNAATTITTGLTTHLIGTIDTLTTYTGNTPQTGDAFARIGATGSGLTSLAPSATAISNAVWTNTKAGFIDSAISGISGGGGGVDVISILGSAEAARTLKRNLVK